MQRKSQSNTPRRRTLTERLENVTEQTALYIRPIYRQELEKLIGRPVVHPFDRAHLEVHGLLMESPEAERIKKLARSRGFLICGQVPTRRRGSLAKPGEAMVLYLHVSSERVRQDLTQRQLQQVPPSAPTRP